jgi:GTP-binding protein
MKSADPSRLPTLAIVGRPNVGKSTLFNRIVGRRRAIVGDEPGITRDRLYAEGNWGGRRLRVVDTGGIIPDEAAQIPTEIFRQARVALDEADAIIMVVDGRTELAAPDLELARLLLRTGKPLFLAVNKVDTLAMEPYAEEFHRLGIRNLFPVSAEHGKGVAELLDAILEVLPAEQPEAGPTEITEEQTEEVRVAIIGRPNVGKSTLLNRLTGSARAIVTDIPGTTRDAVDELVEAGGKRYRFIDTAGIRRKGKTKLMAEKLSVVMARKHLESADIALLMIDATEGVTALDANIAGYAHESGRSVVIVINKWDLVITRHLDGSHRPLPYRAERSAGRHHPGSGGNGKRPADRRLYEQQVRNALKFLAYAPVVFISAKSGKNIDKVFRAIERVAAERRKRIPTAEMNRFLQTVDFERASVPASRRVKIYYMTQAAVSPPTFILFTDRPVKLHFSYERFLENQIRRAFGFEGTPIWIKNRARS